MLKSINVQNLNSKFIIYRLHTNDKFDNFQVLKICSVYHTLFHFFLSLKYDEFHRAENFYSWAPIFKKIKNTFISFKKIRKNLWFSQ
jgi:hypothetical protein